MSFGVGRHYSECDELLYEPTGASRGVGCGTFRGQLRLGDHVREFGEILDAMLSVDDVNHRYQKLASICSAASQKLDKALFSRVQLLLSEDSPVSDNLIQEAALKATAILVRKYE